MPKLSRLFVTFSLILTSFVLSSSLKAQETQTDAPNVIYSNTAPITINTSPNTLIAPVPAQPYPSTVSVSGMSGTTTKIRVSLLSLNHADLRDVDLLLVSPTGQKFILLSDTNFAGANFLPGIRDVNLTFDDAATRTINTGIFAEPGSFRPTNFNDSSLDNFPAPAPAAPYNLPAPTGTATLASTFNGADPNGTWSLFAVDDNVNSNAGHISLGWQLDVTTSGTAETSFANNTPIIFGDSLAPASAYPSNITVSGASGSITNLKVTLNNITHANPSDLDILLVSPNGKGVILMSDPSVTPANNATVTFDDAATAAVNQVVTGTFRPINFGSETDIFFPPAPFALYDSSILANFNGFSPNGTWALYVIDDSRVSDGQIAGGWSLDITTAPFAAPALGCFVPTYSAATNFAVGANPTNLATGDFNNDSRLDLVVTNQVSNDVSILINNGNGGFTPQTTLAAGTNPYAVAVGRFNNDNNLDLAVVNSGSNNVSILFGNGNGTFSTATNYNVGASPIAVAAGDFNNDTRLDLAVANFGGFFAGTVSILLNNGSGGFTQGTSLRAGTQPSFVAVGNFNNDSNPDLAIANFGSSSVSIFLGNGGGTFRSAPNVTVGAGPVSIALADLNNDGRTDFVTSNYNANNSSNRLGDGNGNFTASGGTSNLSNPASVAIGNVLGGSTLTPVFANSNSNKISFDTAIAATAFDVGVNPNSVILADFNNDNRLDIATANFGSNDVSLLLNVCSVARGNNFDFNGDRRTDLHVYRPTNSTWYLQNGGSTVFGNPSDRLVPADYDGDGTTEIGIFRPANALWFVPKSVSNSLQGTTYFLQFGLPTDIPVPADYDGDRRADIAVFRPSTGFWFIRQSSDNSLRAQQFGITGDKPLQGDFDGDGKADLAVFRPSNGIWFVLQSSNNQFVATPFGLSTDLLVPGDYDGDGKTDIAVYRGGIWYYIRSSDNAIRGFSWGIAGDIPVPGDYDSDGKFDFAVFRPSAGFWYVNRSSDGTLQAAQWGTNGDAPIPAAFVR